ncbi:MAG TPA: aldehyde dehydrogenase family protein [Candidatus Cryosericum sp.]|nr:aldehyde dehydrogenase family protein [Candidatus Cryosericum sp.]
MEPKEYIAELMAKARKAQAQIADYSQEQIDALVRAVGKAGYDNVETLAQLAVEETKMGRVDSKIVKNRKSTMVAWYYLKDKKSVGVVEEDPVEQIVTIAKPIGVIGCVTPVTNPTATPLVNGMHVLKGRNAAIFAPHPTSKKSSGYTVKLMREAIEKLGAPADLVQVIEEPTIELTQLLMGAVDVVVATGGPGMVKAAYSSGKPSYGVGQGNVQILVDEDYADYAAIAASTVFSRSYDNGLPCTCDQTMFVPQSRFQEMVGLLVKSKAVYIDDPAIIEKLRVTAFTPEGAINRKFVGATMPQIAEMLGVTFPADAAILVVPVHAPIGKEILCREIMSPVLRLFPYKTFEEAVANAETNYWEEGKGHSCSVYSANDAHIDLVANKIPVCRIMVNQTALNASGGAFNNGLPPTISIGCGFWGGNSIGENLTYKHLMNYTRVSRIIPGAPSPTPEEIWGE